MANSKLCKELTILFPKDKLDDLYLESAKMRLSPGKFIRKIVLDYLEKHGVPILASVIPEIINTQNSKMYILKNISPHEPGRYVRNFPCKLVTTIENFNYDEYYKKTGILDLRKHYNSTPITEITIE